MHSDWKTHLQSLLEISTGAIPQERLRLLEQFALDEANSKAIEIILENQEMLAMKWKQQTRIQDIMDQPMAIPNATVGKPYEAWIDIEKLGWDDVSILAFHGLEEIGLQYDPESRKISGMPNQSGNIKLDLEFSITTAADPVPGHKYFILVINPDPKSLWKNIASDREDPFWKEDEVVVADKLGDKKIVVASKRGRSHANVGSFRDDDFAYHHFEDNGWSVVAVSDGAGSAKLSREGSRIACQTIIDYFSIHLSMESFTAFDELVLAHHNKVGEDTQKKLNHFLYNNLGKAALSVYKKLEETAALQHAELRDFHATLIFALIRKYDFGYAILTFGVGDCPIALLNRDLTEVTLMNKLDVGEYGGGTRFITMKEIFESNQLSRRFGFQLVSDFSYLMLMTDGIYDPKFVVEANLEKIEKWQAFVADLQGDNDEKAKVDFTADDLTIKEQLGAWMDFWSAGNHDDRTLAIIYQEAVNEHQNS